MTNIGTSKMSVLEVILNPVTQKENLEIVIYTHGKEANFIEYKLKYGQKRDIKVLVKRGLNNIY